MKIKIISKKEYDELIRLLKEAYVLVKSLDAENKRLKRDLKDLQDFCMNYSKDRNLDFPSTKKLNEDKFI